MTWLPYSLIELNNSEAALGGAVTLFMSRRFSVCTVSSTILQRTACRAHAFTIARRRNQGKHNDICVSSVVTWIPRQAFRIELEPPTLAHRTLVSCENPDIGPADQPIGGNLLSMWNLIDLCD